MKNVKHYWTYPFGRKNGTVHHINIRYKGQVYSYSYCIAKEIRKDRSKVRYIKGNMIREMNNYAIKYIGKKLEEIIK